MGQSKEMALITIRDLKEYHPEYYNQLHPKCQTCKNIMSSEECEICEKFDMFVNVNTSEIGGRYEF